MTSSVPVASHWLLCCFDCGTPTRAIISAVKATTTDEDVRELARQALVRHHDTTEHTDVFIMCARRQDKTWVTVVPEVLMHPASRANIFSAAVSMAASYRARYGPHTGDSLHSVSMPKGEIIQTLDLVRDLAHAHQDATDSDLADD